MDGKELLERIFEEIVNQGHLETIDELMAENYVDHGPMGDLQGRDAFRASIAAWRAAVPDVHCDVSNYFQDGEMAAWLVHTTGTHTGDALGFPATGKPFETLSANIGRMRDGQAVEHWSEQGIFPMLAQIGMLPTGG